MTTTIRSLMIAASLGVALGATVPAHAQAEDPEAYGDGYQQGDYGRIRSADHGASIARADGQTDEGERAGINAPLFPGDTLLTDGSQRVEVQLANGTLVRLDRASTLAFQSLPDPSAKFQDNSVLALNSGTLRIKANLDEKDEFRIDTPDASVYLVGEGEFRIEVQGGRGTRVASLRGVAEVVGNESSVLVRGGTRAIVIAGSAPGNPQSYTAFASDGFDRWCASRDDAYRTQDRYALDEDYDRESLPDEVEPYYGELSANGSWIDDPTYGTVWYPSGVAVGWSPYTNGYWSYGPGGYFWVSYEPWGWAPYHYGNWQWIGSRGWCWLPGRLFAGAWVSWSWGSSYIGWAPLDYWGRPGWAGGSYYHGYYDPGCWTFVGYGHIGSTHPYRYAVPVGSVGDDLRHATVVSRPPSVDPRRLGNSNSLRDRALREVATDRPAHMRPIDRRVTPTRTLSDIQAQRNPRSARAMVDPRRKGNSPTRLNNVDRLRDQRRATTPSGPGTGRDQQEVARPRRIQEDPRNLQRQAAPGGATRTEPRNDVRELYQRMSRPRETREQNATTQRSQGQRTGPDRQQTERPRANVDPRRREQPQRSQPRDYVDQQRQQPQRSQPRSYDAPRQQQPQRSQPRDYVDRQRQQPQRSQPRSYDAPRQQQPQRSQPRSYDAPRQQQPQRQQPQRSQPRVEPQRQQPQRSQPRVDAPRQQQPQRQQPRAQQPQRQQPQRSTKSDAKQGQGNNKHR